MLGRLRSQPCLSIVTLLRDIVILMPAILTKTRDILMKWQQRPQSVS